MASCYCTRPSKSIILVSPWLLKWWRRGGIVPSASHTLFAKNVQDHFPHAKLIASQVGTMKLRKMGARVDFEYTSDEGLSATRRALGSLGIVFFRLDGCTNQECCVVHEASNVLLLVNSCIPVRKMRPLAV